MGRFDGRTERESRRRVEDIKEVDRSERRKPLDRKKASNSILSEKECMDFVRSCFMISDEVRMPIIIANPNNDKPLISFEVVVDRAGSAKLLIIDRYDISRTTSSQKVLDRVKNIMTHQDVTDKDFAKHIINLERSVFDIVSEDEDAIDDYDNGLEVGGITCYPLMNRKGRLAFKYEAVQNISQLIKDDSAF